MKALERLTAKGTPVHAALRRFAWSLSAGTAILALGACDNAVSPTAPATVSPAASPSPTAVAPSLSVRGLVVDASGKPLADVSVYWFVAGDAPDDIPPSRYAHTDASGSYLLRASGDALESIGGWFWVGVSEQGFRGDAKNLKVPDPACTWDDRKCDLLVNFTLTPQ